MKTIGQVLQLSCDWLKSKSSSHSRREVEELIAFTLKCKRLDIYLHFDKPLLEQELAKIRSNLSRLATNEPLQYIEGQVEFYGCHIMVDNRVLIPRPETELLVDHVVKTLSTQNLQNKVLWDICTGSGCIGISVKKSLPDLKVVLADLSKDALQVAQENSKLNQVDLECVLGDFFTPFANQMCDYLICNPPYISEDEYRELEPHVRDFEPKGALVANLNGLEFYERLARDSKNFVRPGGRVFLEIGQEQSEPCRKLFSTYANLKVKKDLAGIERFIEFEIPSYSDF